MIFDSHTHLFAPVVIANVARLGGLAADLCLDVEKARARTEKSSLKQGLEAARISGSLLLPTAPAGGVRKVNELFVKAVEGEKHLFTAGTLHPLAPDIGQEMEWLSGRGVRALKLCSFSQSFDLGAIESFRLFEKIQAHNASGRPRFFVVLDTFYQADIYFGTPGDHLTTPEKLGRIAAEFPEIDFVGAHMGGLCAPLNEVREHLFPRPNLYLDTSNAAHLLSREEFVSRLRLHGPEHVLFGTDWPWFSHDEEVPLIRGLLDEAGLSGPQQSAIFSGNISRLLGLR